MSARPRLVEEGAPIYGPGSEEPSRRIAVDDHDMGESDDNIHHHGMTPTTNVTTTTKQVHSSLQAAAAKSSFSKCSTKKRSSGGGVSARYEIGAGSGAATHMSNYHDQHYSSPSPHSASWSNNSETMLHTQSPRAASSLSYHQPHHPQQQQPHAHTSNYTITGNDNHYHQTSIHSHDVMEMEADHYASHPHLHPVGHYENHHYHQQPQSYAIHPPLSSPSPSEASHYYQHQHHVAPTVVQTSYTIGGGDNHNPTMGPPVEKMVGVEDHGHKAPMVVLDGANVAHAYGTAVAGLYTNNGKKKQSEPDARGIQVAVEYFETAGIRVLVVLPQYWFRTKPRPGMVASWNDICTAEQQQVLNALQAKGLIVASPPADDDDAYALTIARREESRSLHKRNGEGPGFVLSNDMFRDAQARDTTDALKQWLNQGRHESIGPGRISYSFADMGTMNDNGERILDFVPNPRHPLVIWIEGMSLQGGGGGAAATVLP